MMLVPFVPLLIVAVGRVKPAYSISLSPPGPYAEGLVSFLDVCTPRSTLFRAQHSLRHRAGSVVVMVPLPGGTFILRGNRPFVHLVQLTAGTPFSDIVGGNRSPAHLSWIEKK